MDYILKPKKISKKELYDLDENNLMFITNPGRMGDEDGSTFIIKKGDDYISYRVDGLLYPNGNNSNDYIALNDMFTVFPKWKDSWHNYYHNKKYKGKYKYIYMGFGNGLCIDKSIYQNYYPYLINEIKNSYSNKDENGKYDPVLYYSSWNQALLNMLSESTIKKEKH